MPRMCVHIHTSGVSLRVPVLEKLSQPYLCVRYSIDLISIDGLYTRIYNTL